jgi:hypothetical protein
MNPRVLFPLLTLIFFASTCVLAFLYLQDRPDPLQTELSHVATEPSPPEPLITAEELQQLRELANEQKELKLLTERLSVDLKLSGDAKEVLDQIQLGRQVVRDFEKHFLNHPFFLKQGGLFAYLRKKVERYLNQQEILLEDTGIAQAEVAQLRKDLLAWIVERSDEEVDGAARYAAFFFAETLYDLPLSLLASRMVPDIEAVNFDEPVRVQEVRTTAIRDEDGELNESGKVELERYTIAQQFFFRRGPKVSGRVVLFLKSYLAYSGT